MKIRSIVALALLVLALPTVAGAQSVTQKAVLTYEGARTVAAAAEEEARRNQWNVTIVVVDDAGVPLYVKRMDGASAPTSRSPWARPGRRPRSGGPAGPSRRWRPSGESRFPG